MFLLVARYYSIKNGRGHKVAPGSNKKESSLLKLDDLRSIFAPIGGVINDDTPISNASWLANNGLAGRKSDAVLVAVDRIEARDVKRNHDGLTAFKHSVGWPTGQNFVVGRQVGSDFGVADFRTVRLSGMSEAIRLDRLVVASPEAMANQMKP